MTVSGKLLSSAIRHTSVVDETRLAAVSSSIWQGFADTRSKTTLIMLIMQRANYLYI